LAAYLSGRLSAGDERWEPGVHDMAMQQKGGTRLDSATALR